MVSEARACGLAVLRRTFEDGAYTDRAMHAASRGLDPRDRALAMRLAYGAVQRRATLDHLIEGLTDRSIDAIDPPLRASLRLGLYELLWMESAPHAVVHDTVELAKGSRGHGLANAVLRRATREAAGLLGGLDDATPAGAAIKHSMPVWIVELWWEALGADAARALLARCNEPAEHALRANMIVTDAARLAAALPVSSSVPGDPPEAVIALERFDAHASDLWRDGTFMPQSRAAMLVGHAVDPQPGERILDLCAAPGGKTTHLAALVGPSGQVVAVERHAGRARALVRTAERMRAANVTVVVGDAGEPRDLGGAFDRVLVDPPCSGLGTLQSRPDLRWRATPETVAGLAVAQARLLSVAAGALAPGGRLVYSTCTISPDENEHQIDAFLDDHPDFAAVDLRPGFPAWADRPAILALPHVQGSDGFYIAALRRA
ncbi:MAG TPA: 16S rRNA (cytosine(967)-C(5))-methyltransferase RsmB [Solirubrobacteraceae bacterium]|jgi:16S rRNA (cytosine967-C5)-methyltransferase|nr:16S rRNA (cytosine(967)-C(5))-methyltransferase RsmB [Solirubrobacteraceae bacterium]